MSYLELAKQVLTARSPQARPWRCSECARLEQRDVTVLRCTVCGYTAPPAAMPAYRRGHRIYPRATAMLHFEGGVAGGIRRHGFWDPAGSVLNDRGGIVE